MAYADMHDLMDITEAMISGLVKYVTGSHKITYHPDGKDKADAKKYEIDFSTPWKRFDMIKELESQSRSPSRPPTRSTPRRRASSSTTSAPRTTSSAARRARAPRLIDKLVGEYIEVQCINPASSSAPAGHEPARQGPPRDQGPLRALRDLRRHQGDLQRLHRAQRPFDQRARFEEQARQAAAGDDEAQGIDTVFVDALEHGLPPTGGWGLGIDRLTMFLTDNYTIKEVLAFPAMKPEAIADVVLPQQRPSARLQAPPPLTRLHRVVELVVCTIS